MKCWFINYMRKKRSKEFSDVIIVILLVAVVLASFIGSFMVYNTVSNVQSAPKAVVTNEAGGSMDWSTGRVMLTVVDSDEIGDLT